MYKKIALVSAALISFSAFAGGGFLWFYPLEKVTHLPNHVITFGIVGILMTIIGLAYRTKVAGAQNLVVPDSGISLRNIVEAYGNFIYTQCNAVLGEKDAPKYFQFVATIFIIIFINNVIGLIPGFLPPTESLNTTLALGAFAFVFYNIKGIKEVGFVDYMKHFAGPLWYMAILIFPIEILSNFIRPISLALRLRGNMMGDHKVLETFLNLEILGFRLAWVGGAIPFYLLGLLVCFIQAYVFTMLSMVYISLATAHHDHDDHH